MVVGLILVMALAGAWLGGFIGRFTPFGGWLVAGLLQQVIVAYATLVVVQANISKLAHLSSSAPGF